MSFFRILFFRSFTFLLLFVSGWAFGFQTPADTVFSFPFHTDSRLIVFEGEMNGIKSFFAFDTGAALGLADKNFVESNRAKFRGKKMQVRDTNNQIKSVKPAYTDEMKIGGFKITNVKSLITEMPYLACQNFYLLGSNVIELLNWKIDFDKKIIQVSQKPFAVQPEYHRIPVKYVNTRPFTDLSFGGMKLRNILIDFGFSRVLDIDSESDLVSNFIQVKEREGKVIRNLAYSSGAVSDATELNFTTKLDTLTINGRSFQEIPIDFLVTKSSKIGLDFFQKLSHQTIINNSEKSYYLNLRKEVKFKDPMFLNLKYEKGKVLISGKAISSSGDWEKIEIGDEILEINGRSTTDFITECDFVKWYYTYDADDMTIKTSNGKALKVSRMSLN